MYVISHRVDFSHKYRLYEYFSAYSTVASFILVAQAQLRGASEVWNLRSWSLFYFEQWIPARRRVAWTHFVIRKTGRRIRSLLTAIVLMGIWECPTLLVDSSVRMHALSILALFAHVAPRVSAALVVACHLFPVAFSSQRCLYPFCNLIVAFMVFRFNRTLSASASWSCDFHVKVALTLWRDLSGNYISEFPNVGVAPWFSQISTLFVRSAPFLNM
jgi:hypothetical protein